MVEHKEEDGRHLIEYEKGNKKFYTDTERFIDDDEDFSDRIPDDKLPQAFKDNGASNLSELENADEETVEKVKGQKGFGKLKKEDKEKYLEEKVK